MKRKIHAIKDEKIGIIPLGGKNKGKYVIIDYEDIEHCQKCNWHLCGQGYAKTRTPESRHIYLHRYIYEFHGIYDETKVIDHIDGNKLNNTKENLRYITQQQNTWNRKKHSNNSSGFRGVRFVDNHWISRITHNGEMHHLGFFDSYENAVKARIDAEIELFGEYRNETVDSLNASHSRIRGRKPGKRNTSGIVGVQKIKNGKWYASITINKQRHNLGTYHRKEDAIRARINAENKMLNDERKKSDF